MKNCFGISSETFLLLIGIFCWFSLEMPAYFLNKSLSFYDHTFLRDLKMWGNVAPALTAFIFLFYRRGKKSIIPYTTWICSITLKQRYITVLLLVVLSFAMTFSLQKLVDSKRHITIKEKIPNKSGKALSEFAKANGWRLRFRGNELQFYPNTVEVKEEILLKLKPPKNNTTHN